MSEEINHYRRRILGAVALTTATSRSGITGSAAAGLLAQLPFGGAGHDLTPAAQPA